MVGTFSRSNGVKIIVFVLGVLSTCLLRRLPASSFLETGEVSKDIRTCFASSYRQTKDGIIALIDDYRVPQVHAMHIVPIQGHQ